MTAQTTPRRINVSRIPGDIAAATVGLLLGVGMVEICHLKHWPRPVPYTVIGLVSLWLASVGADRLVRRVRRAR